MTQFTQELKSTVSEMFLIWTSEEWEFFLQKVFWSNHATMLKLKLLFKLHFFFWVLAHGAAVVGKLEKLIFDINKPQRSKAFPACLFTFTVCIFLSPPNLHPHNLPCVQHQCTIKKEINRPIHFFLHLGVYYYCC